MEKTVDHRQEVADQELAEAIAHVVAKDEVELRPSDVSFLKARRMYLTADQIAKYPSVFGEAEIIEDEEKKPVDVSLLIRGIDNFNDLTTPQLTELGKALKMQGLNLFKSEEKLRAKVIEALEEYRKKNQAE